MKKLKHSKYKNTGILFEMLVRKLTSETMTSDKSVTIDIIKKYFGKNTELAKEIKLYNAILKEQFKSEAKALEYIRSLKEAHKKLNKSTLRRERYNLVKEISNNFKLNQISKIRVLNYKLLASAYIIFENDEADNPKQIMECKSNIVDSIITERAQAEKQTDTVLEAFKSQSKDHRLLTYELLVDKFNSKYSVLDENQKGLLNKYITNVNDTEALKEYIQTVIPTIKKGLGSHVSHINDAATRIKVERLSEMLCDVENINIVKESHVLNLLRYFDLLKELNGVHK
tara:strand:+ start:5477 stop:6331 length:855 start_codon:yes stop_codon:yes gene_type:complete